MTIKHIVFDIGQVLVHWDPHLIYTDLIPDDIERKAFIANVCTPEWNIEQDRGRDWKEAEDLLIADHPEKTDLIRAYRSNWMSSIPHAYDEVAAIMVDLVSSGIDVTMLTNFNQETYKMVTERFSFFGEPRGVTVSGEVKMVKPNRDIYEVHNNSFDLTREQTLFIDDSAPNIAMARDFGWNGIQFAGAEGASKLTEQLAEFGVAA
ncbi:MAG: HAD-IA family hydrolase [Rhizobiaceae bacterium]